MFWVLNLGVVRRPENVNEGSYDTLLSFFERRNAFCGVNDQSNVIEAARTN